jgi:chromosome segregation protein
MLRSELITKLAEEGEGEIKNITTLDAARSFFSSFVQKLRNLTHEAQSGSGDIESLTSERDAAMQEEERYAREEAELSRTIDVMRAEVDAAHKEEREQERLLFELTAAEREIRHKIARIQSEAERLSLEEAEFTRELAEIAPLVGREVLAFQSISIPVTVSREEQEREKRDLEKMKIRLEEMGLSGGEEIMKEYKEVSEREQFLEKEIGDLTQSAAQLKTLIADLEHELSKRFDEGLHSINAEFTRLFALMFDGGSASLVRIKEPVRRPRLMGLEGEGDEESANEEDSPKEFVEGIDIALTIPRKRIKSLVMLSGGERALTSIALIFAMSLVNPPPFLVLDETDAALDEANSRRYGDMVRGLSERSQLMVITHNRETMSRAGILYGVTMGNDGVSKVLSVKLEEAVKVAK